MATEVDLQKSLIDTFKTLNDFSGITFLTSSNVSYPNKSFTVPEDNRYFVVNFLCNAPKNAALGYDSQNFYTGYLQIDICVPLDCGEDEVDTKYKWISKLFAKGKMIDNDITILRTYRTHSEAESNCYTTTIKIEFEAVIDKE